MTTPSVIVVRKLALGRPGERKLHEASEVHALPPDVVAGDVVVAQLWQQCLERDLRFEPRERSAEAAMDASSERGELGDLARHVELLRAVEFTLVAVGGAVEQQHSRVLRDYAVVQLDLARRRLDEVLDDRFEAEDLLDRSGNLRWVVDQRRTLLRVLGEELE